MLAGLEGTGLVAGLCRPPKSLTMALKDSSEARGLGRARLWIAKQKSWKHGSKVQSMSSFF